VNRRYLEEATRNGRAIDLNHTVSTKVVPGAFENRAYAAEGRFPMDPIRSIRLRWVHGTFAGVRHPLTGSAFSPLAPLPWQPAVNAYRCETCILVCVDLAGVPRADIDLTIESQRLILRGTREVLEPVDGEECVLQTIAMEIDYGPFLRVLSLPEDIDVDKTKAEQRNGFLWITLPLKKS
jgi:HSP20 family protein